MSRSRASRVTEVATSQHNLPAALSTFVGRDNELRETRRLLGATRVLTLIGAGGVGKTRLAVHLGAAVLEAYPDGVWLVDLTPVAHPRRVARAVAGVLGLHERAGTPLVRLVADALRDNRVLLVLDNCEHVLEACARLAEHLLRACPALQVLATSRAPLGVDGEQLWRVPSLAVPEPPDTPDRVARSAAAELFIQRAAAVEATLRLGKRDGASRRVHLPAAGWHPASAGARGNPRRSAVGRADRRPLGRPVPAPGRRPPHGATTPADAPGDARVEPRAAR